MIWACEYNLKKTVVDRVTGRRMMEGTIGFQNPNGGWADGYRTYSRIWNADNNCPYFRKRWFRKEEDKVICMNCKYFKKNDFYIGE